MILKLISILSFTFSDSKTYVRPSKKLLDEHELDSIIKLNLDRARKEITKVEYNLHLMDLAQYTVNKLAKKGVLELPYLRLCKKYVGYALNIRAT